MKNWDLVAAATLLFVGLTAFYWSPEERFNREVESFARQRADAHRLFEEGAHLTEFEAVLGEPTDRYFLEPELARANFAMDEVEILSYQSPYYYGHVYHTDVIVDREGNVLKVLDTSLTAYRDPD